MCNLANKMYWGGYEAALNRGQEKLIETKYKSNSQRKQQSNTTHEKPRRLYP